MKSSEEDQEVRMVLGVPHVRMRCGDCGEMMLTQKKGPSLFCTRCRDEQMEAGSLLIGAGVPHHSFPKSDRQYDGHHSFALRLHLAQ